LTNSISLVGKYIVFLPYENFVTVSARIDNPEERNRLPKIVRVILPKGTGAIIRTEAKWKRQLELQQDLQILLTKWKNIREAIDKNDKVPNVIYQNTELLDKVITNITPPKINKIITDSRETIERYENVKGFKSNSNFNNSVNSKFRISESDNTVELIYQENFDLVSDIEKQLEISKNRKVWLPSGAYITIEKTEALTAIDVNTAKYVGKKNEQETFFKVNKEATYEVARQLRLRNISGMILIDYINMESELDKLEIYQLLKEELKKDRSKTDVLGFTKLNLLEMTRQHLNG